MPGRNCADQACAGSLLGQKIVNNVGYRYFARLPQLKADENKRSDEATKTQNLQPVSLIVIVHLAPRAIIVIHAVKIQQDISLGQKAAGQ